MDGWIELTELKLLSHWLSTFQFEGIIVNGQNYYSSAFLFQFISSLLLYLFIFFVNSIHISSARFIKP